jgi:hypothetical protein
LDGRLLSASPRLRGLLPGSLEGSLLGFVPVLLPELAFGGESPGGEGADGGFGLQRAHPCSGVPELGGGAGELLLGLGE